MNKYEKKAREMMNPAPATKNIWRPSDYIGYSDNFDHSSNPEPVPSSSPQMREDMAQDKVQSNSALRKATGLFEEPPPPPDAGWYKNDRAQELMRMLGLETSPSGEPIIDVDDEKIMASGKGYLSKDPSVKARSELLDRLLIGDDFADQYYPRP